jgi:cell division transport system permease protein
MALKVDYVFKETGTNLRRNITLTLATTVTVAVSLVLVGGALLIRQGVSNATLKWKGDVDFIIYMKNDAPEGQINAMRDSLKNSPQVKKFTYLDHQQAWDEFKRLFKDQPDLVQNTTPDVLPTSFKVTPTNASADFVNALKSQFEKDPGVVEVVAATDTIRTMQRVSGILSTGILVVAVILTVAAAVLITNTIRTAMFARRREIEVMKLVGATNWFIRVPFMLEGLTQGVVGSAFGVVGIYTLNRFFQTKVANASGFDLLGSFVVSHNDLFATSLFVIIMGCLVGVAGSGFAVTRFLDV